VSAVDWFAPATVAEPAPAPAPRPRHRAAPPAAPARRATPRAARRQGRLRVTGGIVWMTAFALLLAGVVAVNVAVLRANMAVHRLDNERAQLQAENQALASQLSAAGAAPRIEAAARRLGLVEAQSADTSYLDLARP
jgi:cell division protein FtsL